VLNYTRGRDPAYAAASEAFRKEYFAMLADLDKTLASEQRAKAVARFRGVGEDFAALVSPRGDAKAGEARPPQ
jgi:hypothetical protein